MVLPGMAASLSCMNFVGTFPNTPLALHGPYSSSGPSAAANHDANLPGEGAGQ